MSGLTQRYCLQRNITLSAAALTAASGTIHGSLKNLLHRPVVRGAFYLDITSHDNTNANETYDFFIWTGTDFPNGNRRYWDIGAFTQVSGATAAVAQTLHIQNTGYPGTHTIADGTVTKHPANQADVITTSTRCTTTAAFALHGYFGDFIGYSIVGGGTTPGAIVYEVIARIDYL